MMSRTLRHARIAAALAAAVALLAPASASAACPGADDSPNQVSLGAAERSTLCLLNVERRSHGLPKLRRNPRLDLASKRHARSMAVHHFFEHGNFVGRIRAANYLRGARSWTVGENIAWGSGSLATPAEIVDAWMHSPGHRANILSRSFREIGIGVARGAPERGVGDGATYATDFGARG